MKKSILSIGIVAGLLFSGCGVVERGIVEQKVRFGKTTVAKASTDIPDIPKDKKVYIKDLTDTSITKSPAYSNDMSFTFKGKYLPIYIDNVAKLCAPGRYVAYEMRDQGWKVVNNESEADYTVYVKNIGCGRLGEVKNHLLAPTNIGNQVVKRQIRADGQGGLSLVRSGDMMRNAGFSKIGMMTGALGVLGMFTSKKKMERYVYSFNQLTTYDHKNGKVNSVMIYSPTYVTNQVKAYDMAHRYVDMQKEFFRITAREVGKKASMILQ